MTKRITRADAVEAAKALDLPEPFLTLASGDWPSGRLNGFFGPVGEFYLEADHGEFAEKGIIPLWDDGSFYEVVAVERDTGRFLVFDTEEVVDVDAVPRLNYQQVLVDIFCRLWEAEVPEPEFRELAEELGFNEPDEVIAGYERLDLSSFEKHEAWKNELIAKLGRSARIVMRRNSRSAEPVDIYVNGV